MSNHEICRLPGARLARLIRKRELPASEALREYLERKRALEPKRAALSHAAE